MPDDASAKQQAGGDGSIKETLISLAISFVMALVFRSYVVEAFMIPTGSMAPTLLGAHMSFRSPQSGAEWPVNPWYAVGDTPVQPQGAGQAGPPSATDPMSTSLLNRMTESGRLGVPNGFVTTPEVKRLKAGDRILVQKYLYELFPPARWDVVVFKNPELAPQNFIKRLVGLPNEQVWIVDGDVFTRPVSVDADGNATPAGAWRIQRKPDRVQRAVWTTVYSSEFAPLAVERDGRRWFTPPWSGPDGWQGLDSPVYRFDGAGATTLRWDSTRWPVWGWVAYNETPSFVSASRQVQMFPVADLRVRAGVEAAQAGLEVRVTIASHQHEWRAVIADGSASIQMRRGVPGDAEGLEWRELATGRAASFTPGRVVNVEFSRVDQALQLRVDGRLVAEAEYDWSPEERLEAATGAPADAFMPRGYAGPELALASSYRHAVPSVAWSFAGGPFTLHRVGLDRDLFYEPAVMNLAGRPALGTHPAHPAMLGPSEFFMLGDNSPASKDGRLWTDVDAPIREQIGAKTGVVHRDLILGKAFFVYFPAPRPLGNSVPVPDVGRMRFIR